MALLLFLVEAFVISLSGVLAPGPITTVTVGKGSKSPHAGALVALGHGIVEFPLMIAVFYGVGQLFDLPYVKIGIAAVGQCLPADDGRRDAAQRQDGGGGRGSRHAVRPSSPVSWLTVGNPYFLIWWATIGATLISRSVGFGLLGFALFAVIHWSCDFVWDYFLSALSFKGGQFFGKGFQKAVFAVCGVALIFFSVKLAWDAVGMWWSDAHRDDSCVSPSIGRCELTHLKRAPIDVDLARAQHHGYEVALADLGCKVLRLPPMPDLPDSVFVEDIAVVVDELAIITRPGAPSRRPEVPAVADALKPYRELVAIEAPGTLDGGDVLRIDKRVLVGISGRSTLAAIGQMRAALAPLGYTVEGVPVTGCLHLKSAVTQVAADAVLVNPAWVDVALFEGTNVVPGMEVIAVDPVEAYAANAVLIDDSIIYPTAYPRTRALLERRGIPVHTVDVSELIKAEGAVTCCSLILET